MSKFKDSNGYIYVHMPNHHRAKSNGYVAEHIVIAEKIIGRDLKKEEVVHHEDRDRSNNSEDNLFVFATLGDHTRYHRNGLMIKHGDVYISPEVSHKIINCVNCGIECKVLNSRNNSKYCSYKCRDEYSRKSERPSKEDLLNLIKTKSFAEIGRIYNVSDNAIRKWCKSYDLPYRKKDLNIL